MRLVQSGIQFIRFRGRDSALLVSLVPREGGREERRQGGREGGREGGRGKAQS